MKIGFQYIEVGLKLRHFFLGEPFNIGGDM